jgi:hypothetical protein
VNGFVGIESVEGADAWGAPVDVGTVHMINAAIDEAVGIRAPVPSASLPESPSRHDRAWVDEDQPFGCPPLPPPAESTLLDVLPVSIVAPDDLGRLQIEPDEASLQKWARSDREAAIHVTSWLNECGEVRPAIERAIDWGQNRFEDVSREYDEQLEASGFDRMAPRVCDSDRDLRHIHETVEHAKDILTDLQP